MDTLLDVRGLVAGYGPITVLHELSLHVGRGEIVAILGANGAGKSTLLQALVGMIRPTAGAVAFDGHDVNGNSPEQIVRRGMTLVPEGRRIFSKLSVMENLRMGAYSRRDRAVALEQMDRYFELFPVLADRRNQAAGTLSGGEQQQLAICRALLSNPSLLLLDEPSLGLAPVIVDKVFELIATLRDETGLTIVLVEQSVVDALEIADRAYVLSNGRFTAEGTSEQIAELDLEANYLGGDNA
ncbi:MAG: ABC transporter ATP-binding protein [Cryobacterium sp.]|nr:ABC transporter ATP-binding protein [Cryobacterium sp.]